jgi:hypothetical protein
VRRAGPDAVFRFADASPKRRPTRFSSMAFLCRLRATKTLIRWTDGCKPQWIGDQAPFVRPDNSQMEHRRPAECGLYLTCKVNEPTMVYEPKLFPVKLPVI